MSVKSFNALPQPRLSPSGLPNHWYFDLRYIPLDPNPSHVLFLVQLDSGYIHSERLPLGISPHESGIAFFPESGTEAAPEVSRAVLHAFIDGFGIHRFETNPPPPFSPWKLTTEDADLAKAVGDEFKRIGVRDQLCDIDVVKGEALEIAHSAFDGLWKSTKAQMGITGIVEEALTTPYSITLHDLHDPHPETGLENDNDDEGPIETMKAVEYVQRLLSSRPISLKMDPYATSQNTMKEVQTVMELFRTKSSEEAMKEADAGNAESAIDYALRLQLGINCIKSRALSRVYLLKALSIFTSSRSTKSACHALLVRWHTEAPDIIRSRYLHAAAHHANLSIELSPGRVPCPAVLSFGYETLEPLSYQAVELCVQYKAVWAALETRNGQMKEGQEKAEGKRAARAHRYRCANVGCGIQADTGRMLAQCAGKCSPDKKPSYCSKECQRADWTIHKPFCRANAPCSVIIEDDTPAFEAKTKHGALSIPIMRPDGTTRIFRSSTMSSETLKRIKAHFEAEARRSSAQGDEVRMDEDADVSPWYVELQKAELRGGFNFTL